MKRALSVSIVLAAVVWLTTTSSTFAVFGKSRTVPSNAITALTLANPSGLNGPGSGPISLSWTGTTTTQAIGHRVFRSTSSGGPYTEIAVVTPRTATSTVDSPPPGTYYYRVQAFLDSWVSGWTNVVSATVVEPPAITFRASSSSSSASGVLSLTINKPTGTVQGDVMVASIGFRPETPTVTPPSGWNLVRRTNNSAANANGLAVYTKIATASEPGSYTWTFSTSTGTVGGISTFIGVDTNNPVNAEAGSATANSLAHTAPSVNTTVADTMLVTSYTFTSAATWSSPSGMYKSFDVASEPVPTIGGQSISSHYATQTNTGATGTRTSTASNDPDVGVTHTLALRPGPIQFKAATSASAGSGTLSLNIARPTGTTAGDVMVASIGFRPDTPTVNAPSGWNLVRRTNNSAANANGLAVYYKVAGGGEPASYAWTFSTSTGSAGGIATFSGVNTSAPVAAEAGQTTGDALAHAAPSLTTTVANTMLVTSHTFSSSATWEAPAGMYEAFDVASGVAPNAGGQATAMNFSRTPAIGGTGVRTATASGDGDVGVTHALALSPAP